MRHKAILLFAISVMMLGIGTVSSQTEASLCPDTIALGDQSLLTIAGGSSYPSAEMLSRGDIVVISQEFDTTNTILSTIITCFEPGQHYIHITDNDSILLTVTDVDIDTANAELRDIATIERMPYSLWEILRWVLLVIVVAGAAWGIWWLITHRQHIKQLVTAATPVDTRTPQERASERLEKLRNQRLWQVGKTKEYYTELTDTVRTFIEETTGIRATDMTSDETLDAIRQYDGKEMLSGIFHIADMVKFAKSEPMPHEHDLALDNAIHYVDTLWEQVKPRKEGNDE